MKINKVVLKNIGPHEDLQVELQSGMIGVLGANGAGKSTFINATYAALTNDFSRFGGTKADVIKNDCGKARSFITLQGEHRGQSFELTRHLRPNKNELVIEGNGKTRVFTKANEVNEAVESELNVNKLVIDKYVFVNQWDMFSFLSQTASERAKTFQYLCGTSEASKIHKACLDYSNRRTGEMLVDNSADLEASIEECTTRMADLKQECLDAKSQMIGEAEIEEFRALLARKDVADAALEQVVKYDELIETTGNDIARHLQQSAEFTIMAATCEQELQQIEGDDLYQAVKQWDSNQIRDILSNLEDVRLDRHAALESLSILDVKFQDVQLVPDSDFASNRVQTTRRVELEYDQQQLHIRRHEQQQLELMLRQGHEQSCTQCGQMVTEEYLADKREEFKSDALAIATLSASVETRSDLYAAQSEYVATSKRLNDLLSSYKQREEDLLSTLPEGSGVAGEDQLEAASDRLDLHAQVSSALKLNQETLGKLETKAARAQGGLEKLMSSRDEHQVCVDDQPEFDDVISASDAIDKQALLSRTYVGSHGAWVEAKKSRSRTRKTLKKLKLRIVKDVKINSLTKTVLAAGDLFHWNSLPKTVSQANMEMMVDDINENLGLFDNPFYVEASSDLTFLAYFPGKPPVKASQLSGGQKVILAIAFRMALDRVFGHDVGMMFLDEPTAGLDADNVTYFHDALQQLASKVSGDRQLVVITHVQSLGGVFDQLVEIQKG
tara:strand:+ start:5931 stop:8111 length:2181 start_codon:yes stop_codon:yes gene_type:complete